MFGELVGVAHQIQQRLPQPHLVGLHHAEVDGAIDCNPVRVLRRERFDGLDDISDQRR